MKNYKLPGLPKTPGVPPSTTTKSASRNTGIAKIGGFTRSEAQPIQFGRASRAATRNPNTTSTLSRLLSSSSSNSGMGGSLSSALGFGAGIGSLITGLTSIFGGGKTAPPALTAYELPTSQTQTVSINGSSVSTPGVYGGPTTGTPFEANSSAIVQTVKQALLNSSSLNDVIGEL